MRSSRVSIIITCFNQGLIINKAIQSIIDQTYNKWECIIVDDGSSDDSAKIINEYCKIDSRIKYIFQTNQGVSAARNNGFIHSNGEYIQFLDGDDWILPHKIEVQLLAFSENQTIDICYTDHQHYFQKDNTFRHFEFEVLNGTCLQSILFKWDRGVSLPIHTALFKRKLWIDDELPFETTYKGRYEDWLFWVNLALKKTYFYYLNNVCAIYNIHNSNFCNDHSTSIKYFLQAAFYIKSNLPSEIQEQFIDISIDYALEQYATNKENSKSNQEFFLKIADRLFNSIKNKTRKLKKRFM